MRNFYSLTHLRSAVLAFAAVAFAANAQEETPLSVTVTDGETTLTAVAEGGQTPYTYAWTDFAGNKLDGTDILDLANADHTRDYQVVVTDASGATAVAYGRHNLTGGASVIAGFEDNLLAEESWWNGAERVAEAGSFVDGTWKFTNVYTSEWGSWEGFSYANTTANTYGGNYATEQYNLTIGRPHSGNNFAVVFTNTYTCECAMMPTNAPTAEAVGMWYTTTAWTSDAVANGDGWSPAFGKGDYLKLIVTGYDVEGKTTTVETYLADFRSENAADRYCLSTWEWLDLSSLGSVAKIVFSIETTKNSEYGPTTPSYFALDDFGANRVEETIDGVIVTDDFRTIDLSTLLTIEGLPEGATTVYSVETSADKAVVEGNILTVTAPAGSQINPTIHATACGQHRYAVLPITVAEAPEGAINAVEAEKAVVVERYDMMGRRIANPEAGMLFIEVYSDGSARKVIR